MTAATVPAAQDQPALPSREAVYRDEVDDLGDRGEKLVTEAEPFDALLVCADEPLLLAALGCTVRDGRVVADPAGRTDVPGVSVAGRVAATIASARPIAPAMPRRDWVSSSSAPISRIILRRSMLAPSGITTISL